MLYRFIAVGLLLSVTDVAMTQEAKKWPIPNKDAQAKIESLLQELFKDNLTKAEKDPGERARLAQTFLFEGRETKDDPAGRYVLFFKAHTLAAQAGDITTALVAVDELGRNFAIPPAEIAQMKIKMVQQASKVKDAPASAYQMVVDRALATLEDTLDHDDYPSSQALIAAAEQAAIRLRSLNLVVSVRKKQDEIDRMAKEFSRWKSFADTLAKDPKNAEANLEMGKYHALVKGNWDRGLPLLAKGKISPLQALAAADQVGAVTDNQRRILGLGWFNFANDKDTDPAMKTQALLRSYRWYQENLSNSDEKQRPLLEARLLQISDLLPLEYRIGEIRTELKKVDLPTGPVYSAAFSADGKHFVATGYDGNVRLFNSRTGAELRLFSGHAGKVWCVAFANDNRHFASGGFDGVIRLWDINATPGTAAPGESAGLKTFEGHKDYVRSVAISDNQKWILSGGDDRTVRLWNVATGKEERLMKGHDHSVWCVALSRDGKRALSASLDKTARYWDVENGETIRQLEGHKDTVLCVAFTPDGRHAVTGSTDKTLRLWDLATGKTTQIFEGSTGYVHTVAVSPDGRRILSAGADNVLRMWDTATGKELRKLEGHREPIWHVAFSRDGRLAITSGQDNCVRVWTGAK